MARSETNSPGLTPRELQLAVLLARGRTYEAAATELGTSRSTVARMLKKVKVREEIASLRAEAANAAAGAFLDGAADAARELRRMVGDGAVTDGAKVAACRALAEFALRFREVVNLSDELAELKELVRANAAAGGKPEVPAVPAPPTLPAAPLEPETNDPADGAELDAIFGRARPAPSI
jgi:DNA-binding CsgD family transcriptional regulator